MMWKCFAFQEVVVSVYSCPLESRYASGTLLKIEPEFMALNELQASDDNAVSRIAARGARS